MSSIPTSNHATNATNFDTTTPEENMSELESIILKFQQSANELIDSVKQATTDLNTGLINFCKSSIDHANALEAIHEYETQESQRIQQIGDSFSGSSFDSMFANMGGN